MSILQQLAKELANSGLLQQKHGRPNVVNEGPALHGENSLFGVVGAEREVFSARIVPTGMASRLPAFPTNNMTPLFQYITGYTAADESPTEVCNCTDECGCTAVRAGNMKVATQTAAFGCFKVISRTLDLSTIGQRINSGETADRRFVNEPFAATLGASIFPNMGDTSMRNILGSEVMVRWMDIGVEMERLLSVHLYTGTGTGEEFAGLDILINDSKVDAITNVAVPALNSVVQDFGYVSIHTPAGQSALFAAVVDVYRQLRYNAANMNFGQTTWALTMREQLFWEITDIWPVTYFSYRTIPTHSQMQVNVNGADLTNQRDEMRRGYYLVIDGQQVPVVTDSHVPEESRGDGAQASDIYFLPMTIRGNQPVLYWEYFDYRPAVAAVTAMGRGYETTFWTDDGKYIWNSKPNQDTCVEWSAQIKPRIILRTPHLAGRLINVEYAPATHWRDPNAGDPYFVNGGTGSDGNGYDNPYDPLYADWGEVS